MKAWLLDRFEGLSALRMGAAEPAAPGAGEVLLRMKYAALNPADRYLAMGEYPAKPPLPHILGRDGVGIVEQIGRDVSNLQPGQVRAILRGATGVDRAGTLAEFCVVSANELVVVPPGWSEAEAAAAPLVYLTAYQALRQWGELEPGVLLITGASGGVGVASVQLGKALGNKVVALSRSEAKQRRLKELGADICLDPTGDNWVKELKLKLGARRVDLAIDNIGGSLLPQVIDTLGEQGRISVVGRLAGPVPQFNTASLFFRRLRIGGVAVGAYTPDQARSAWIEIVFALNRTHARPQIDSIYPFDQAPEAFSRLETGAMGKVVIAISP